MNTLTLISHIFNEEYLLPFWLEHHSKIFDNGIIIDYYSTDRSIEIINKFCPTWTVIKTKNLNIDGSPNFKADLIDIEVNEIEKTINGYKICLNTSEFLMINKSKNDFINSLSRGMYYNIESHSVMTSKEYSYPNNTVEFFKDIDLFSNNGRGHRTLHSDSKCNYTLGRHSQLSGTSQTNIYRKDFFILWCGFYPWNNKFIERKMQIQQNIPKFDKDRGLGIQHILDNHKLKFLYNSEFKSKIKKNNYDKNIIDTILSTCENLKKNNTYYSELVVDSNWGEDCIIIDNDINLLKNTEYDTCGYKIFDIDNFNDLLQRFIKNEIEHITKKSINLKNYHNEITNEEHTQILNSMPYKKNKSPDIKIFCEYLEVFISKKLNTSIKIFNDDLWVRICRPSKVCNNDYNPCHRDIYLDFYRNVVNIYLPIIGSNDNSSLTIQPGSHKWNENETMVTKNGAFFKHTNKKYSVDAIVASKIELNMIRPNPKDHQLMLFSPYLIHGCANNNNEDITRISLEVRFIQNNENGLNQENIFNQFLKTRNWR